MQFLWIFYERYYMPMLAIKIWIDESKAAKSSNKTNPASYIKESKITQA